VGGDTTGDFELVSHSLTGGTEVGGDRGDLESLGDEREGSLAAVAVQAGQYV
jgi:hypothetical protein